MGPQPFAVALFGLSILTVAHASLKSEIEALNRPIVAALMKRDIDQYKKIVKPHVTSDFIFAEGDTTLNFDQMVGRLRQNYSVFPKVTAFSVKLVSLQEHGAKGTALQKQTIAGIVKNRDNKAHTYASVEMSKETYRLVKGQWKLATKSVWTERVSVDGRPMPSSDTKRHKSGGKGLEK